MQGRDIAIIVGAIVLVILLLGLLGGGMMGWRRSAQPQSVEMPIGPERAQELARQYLKAQGLPLDVAEPDRFYGYYTMHTLRQGAIEGMLSVNGHTGQVWYHVWHGPFIREREAMR